MYWFPLLLLLCEYSQGFSNTSISQNRTMRTVYPLWKPSPKKAFDLCGFDLKDNDLCKLPPWCTGGTGTCCKHECICPSRSNPCASGAMPPTKTTTAMSTTPTLPRGECVLECMKECYKTCLDGTRTPDQCAVECSPGCYKKCGAS